MLNLERVRLPPGPADLGHPDCGLHDNGPAVVRRRHRAVHQPREFAQARERVRGPRREAEIPRRTVRDSAHSHSHSHMQREGIV